MTPIVNGLESSYNAQIEFVSLNAFVEGEAIFASLALPGHPSFVLFDAAGQETFRAFGIVGMGQLEREILDLIQ